MGRKKSVDDQSVLEKAMLVISRVGPDRFTLTDIGKATGLAPATLMQRFGSKQQLLILAAKHANEKLKQDLEQLKKSHLPWDQELIQFLSAVPEGFRSRQEIASSLGVLKLDMVDPELHAIARRLFDSLREHIYKVLKNGQSSNQIHDTLDLKEITWELDALRHGLVIQWTLSGAGSLQKWLEKGIKIYLKRIKK